MKDQDPISYSIILDDPSFRFNATHFVAFQDGKKNWIVEDPHGHDFRVVLQCAAPLNASDCVVDFIAASETLRAILREWDHKLLLPKEPKGAKRVDSKGLVYVVNPNDPRRVFAWPQDCVKDLEFKNASSELIAAAILREFCDALGFKAGVTLRLEEAPGCWAQVAI